MKRALVLAAMAVIVGNAVAADSGPGWKVARTISPIVKFVLVDKTTAQSKYLAIAEAVCGDQPVCNVQFWSDKAMLPAGETTAAELNAQTANYWFNRKTGKKELVWGCPFDKRQCD